LCYRPAATNEPQQQANTGTNQPAVGAIPILPFIHGTTGGDATHAAAAATEPAVSPATAARQAATLPTVPESPPALLAVENETPIRRNDSAISSSAGPGPDVGPRGTAARVASGGHPAEIGSRGTTARVASGGHPAGIGPSFPGGEYSSGTSSSSS
jgi:hypothetical protein